MGLLRWAVRPSRIYVTRQAARPLHGVSPKGRHPPEQTVGAT